MRNETRQAFNAYLQQLAVLNGIDQGSVAKKFSVSPTVQQKLETKMQESSDFLKKINIQGVTEKQGQKLGLSIGNPIASTTNTSTTPRSPVDPSSVNEDDQYDCTQTNFDTYIAYAKLDAWAKFPDFQVRIRNAILARQGLDRIMIGWNGSSRAATSNPATNPLRQDVNIGWLQKYRANSPQRVMNTGATAGQIRVGSAGGADYANLDALVFDLVNEMIDPWYQDDTGLVVICGRSLLADKYFPIVNQNHAPTEQMAADMIISQKRLGGLPAIRVPHFPANSLMVTRLDNLSIYFQEGSRRRTVVEKPELDRIENYESSNDAYVVEDYGLGAVAENIVFTWS